MNFAKFHTRGGRGLQRAHPRIGLPLPPAQGLCGWRTGAAAPYPAARGAASRRAGYRGTDCAGRLPGGRRIPGAGGLPGRRLRPGRYGAHVARRLPGRAYTRRRGYRGKQGGCSPNVGGYRARDYSGGRGGLPVPGRIPGGAIPGRGYPAAGGGRRRGGTAPPGGAATPAGYRGGKLAIREGGL